MWELIIHNGKFQGRRLQIPLGKLVRIGRDSACQLIIPSPLVSRHHCELKRAPEGIWVRDLGSRNGTYVNDVAVTDLILLEEEDQLRIGVLVFTVAKSQSPVPAVTDHKENSKPVAHVVALAAERRRAAQISDDEIAVWLTDEDMPETTSQETSIMSRASQETTTLSPVSVSDDRVTPSFLDEPQAKSRE